MTSEELEGMGNTRLRYEAMAGNPSAQLELALRYARGESLEEDEEVAFGWCLTAARHGYAPAEHELAIMYLQGHGVEPDVDRGMYLMRSAAAKGFLDSQYAIGLLHDEGRFMERDMAEARRWYRMAAILGHVWAQFNLGLSYVGGNDVLMNSVLVHAWWTIAAEGGDEEAGYQKEAIEGRMTTREISRAMVVTEAISRRMRAVELSPEIYLEYEGIAYVYDNEDGALCRACSTERFMVDDDEFDKIFYFSKVITRKRARSLGAVTERF